jgi:hypothetical protein
MDIDIRTTLRLMSATRSPEQITRALGIEPDHSWVMGEPVGRTAMRHKQHSWQLRSRLPADAGLEAQVREVLARVLPAAEALRTFAAANQAYISCAIRLRSAETPPIALSAETVTALARLGLGFDLDLYVQAPEPQPSPSST